MFTDRILLERAEKWLSPLYWSNINLTSSLYHSITLIKNIEVYEPENNLRPSINEIICLYNSNNKNNYFKKTSINQDFFTSWSTKWFYIEIDVLEEYSNKCIGLQWDSNSEALLYDFNGNQIQAFTGGNGNDRRDLCILNDLLNEVNNGKKSYFIEMACNEMFGNGNNGMIRPPNPNKSFNLTSVNLVEINKSGFNLYWDMIVMYDLAKSLPTTSPTYRNLLYIMNEIINKTNIKDNSSLEQSHLIATQFFNNNSNCKVNHDIYALGHCHIDTAWLWPYAETRRKVARSWATQLHLLQSYPEYKFVASQTVQYEWLLEDSPNLFNRIKESVISGNFIPIGGTYVEFDANIPSGESMIRQFLYGMKFLKEQFNVIPKVFWLPDTFGYSSQLPQIMKGFNIEFFLSQKLSWNLINKFPHNTMEWRGIDGSSVIAHFPPADNYESEANPSDIIKTVENNKSKMASNRSLLLFGHGDGGGGPAVSHFEKLNRLKSCESVARIHTNLHPNDFFFKVKEDFEISSKDRHTIPHPIWKGELYLELHQGTFTSQAKIKYQNRLCETLLRGIETLYFINVFSFHKKFIQLTNEGIEYLLSLPKIIEKLWKDTLLNQFHDVIPGSSIGMVYEDSDRMLTEVINLSYYHINILILLLQINHENKYYIFNPCGIQRRHLIENQYVTINSFSFYESNTPIKENIFSLLSSNSNSSNTNNNINVNNIILSDGNQIDGIFITYLSENDYFIMGNQFIEVNISGSGTILSLIDKRLNPPRQIFQSENDKGNNLILYDDIPFYWDAWDIMPYHLMTGKSINDSTQQYAILTMEHHSNIKYVTPEEICIEIILEKWSENNQSKIIMEISLHKDSPLLSFKLDVDWYESHKLLKVEFPLNIQSNVVRYETQFGYTERPTHINHSTDASMFETCGHKYASLSEPGYGVALINNCKYGYSCRESTLCLSLLRSPKSPDPNCDMGKHTFCYGLYPHLNSFLNITNGIEVVSQATLYNSPLLITSNQNNISNLTIQSINSPSSISSINFTNFLRNGLFNLRDGSSLILETIKLAENCQPTHDNIHNLSLEVIVRLYETLGARGNAILECSINPNSVFITNLDETPITTLSNNSTDGKFTYSLLFQPFQIITLKFNFN